MLDHIVKIPAYAAQTFKDKEALVFEGQSFTFNDLTYSSRKLRVGCTVLESVRVMWLLFMPLIRVNGS